MTDPFDPPGPPRGCVALLFALTVIASALTTVAMVLTFAGGHR